MDLTQSYTLLVIFILISLYCMKTYQENYLLQAVLVFGIIWLGVVAIRDEGFTEFGIMLIVFHTVLGMMYLASNLEKVQKEHK